MRIALWFFFLAVCVVAIHETHAYPQMSRSRTADDACLRCHGNQKPQDVPPLAPLLQPQFQMDWKMYEVQSEAPPPYDSLPPNTPVLRGKTYYDWNDRKMVEVYEDKCISIFSSGNDFSCKFISDHDKTYLAKYPIGDLTKATACCRWSETPFWAPRPDVLRNFKYDKTVRLENRWILDIPMPGPFGYSTHAMTGGAIRFWFPVIGAWAEQDFENFKSGKPDPEVFRLPDICRPSAPICEQ